MGFDRVQPAVGSPEILFMIRIVTINFFVVLKCFFSFLFLHFSFFLSGVKRRTAHNVEEAFVNSAVRKQKEEEGKKVSYITLGSTVGVEFVQSIGLMVGQLFTKLVLDPLDE